MKYFLIIGTVLLIASVAIANMSSGGDCDQNGIDDADEIAESPFKDSNGNGILDLCEGFSTNVSEISLLEGGVQELRILMGPSMSGRLYRILGSTTPGPTISFGSVEVPIGVDAYTLHTLYFPNTGPYLARGFSALDSYGKATATFTVPPGSDPALVGAYVYHTYIILTGGATYVVWASNHVKLKLMP